MTTKTPRLLGWVALAILLAWITYLCSQGPKVSMEPDQFGLMLFRGGYRAWYLSFCDGRRGDGKPVYFDLQQNRWQVGYRWPTFRHTDIRKLKPMVIREPIYVTNLFFYNQEELEKANREALRQRDNAR